MVSCCLQSFGNRGPVRSCSTLSRTSGEAHPPDNAAGEAHSYEGPAKRLMLRRKTLMQWAEPPPVKPRSISNRPNFELGRSPEPKWDPLQPSTWNAARNAVHRAHKASWQQTTTTLFATQMPSRKVTKGLYKIKTSV